MDVDVGGFLDENTTYDYPEDYTYTEDEPKNGSEAVVLIPILCSVVLVVGLLGNALLFYVLAQKRRCWSISDKFILNLGVADVLLLLTLPFWAVQAAHRSGWCLGPVLCKICGAVFNINFYCGIFLLACISLDRYLSVVHSVQLYSHKKSMLVPATFLLVWFVSLILTIPDWMFLVAEKDETQKKTLCVHNYSDTKSRTDWQLWPRLLHHTVGLLLPAATLIFCCSSTLLCLQCSPKSLQKERTVTILPLVVVFFMFWMPYNITLIVDTYKNDSKEPIDSSLKTALMVTSALGCVHACLRPLLYLIICGNFRKWALATLRCKAGVKSEVQYKSSLWEMGASEEALPDQSHEAKELNQLTSQSTEQ